MTLRAGIRPWPTGWNLVGNLSSSFAGRAAAPAPSKKPARQQRSPRSEAEARALAFAARKGPGAFKALDREQVARGAIARVYDPNRIAQESASLCGPAALVRSLAGADPVAYVDYIVQLFEFGRAKLRTLVVEPGEDLRNYDPGSQLDHADWIALASLRDSENYILDYDEVDDPLAGVTFPASLESWFRRTGFTRVVNDTNLLIDKDVGNIRAANELYKKDYWVCLFINMNMLMAADMLSGSPWPNHWVMLSSRVAFSADQISFTVFTWGRGYYPVPPVGKSMRIEAFLDNYYGYVAAKY